MLLAILPSFLFASGSGEKIASGNRALAGGDFAKALSLYEEAAVAEPESPYVYFNKGLAYYGLGDYEKARESFLESAAKTPDISLEAKAYYNLGNCDFFDAARFVETDLEKAIELYQSAITNYRLALERNETLTDATQNIEVTRLIVKDLLDKLKQQQEQQKEQRQKQEEIAKKIKELIDREQKEIEHTAALRDEKAGKGTSPSLSNSVRKVKENQQQIRKETVETSGKIEALMNQGMGQQGSPLGAAKEHVDMSVNHQQLAENQLTSMNLEGGVGSEEDARDELIKALEALTGEPQGGGEKQQEERERQEGERQKQSEEEMKAQAEKAEDILDEEEENRKKVQQQATGYQAPPKDW